MSAWRRIAWLPALTVLSGAVAVSGCGESREFPPSEEFTGGALRAVAIGDRPRIVVGHSVTQAPLQNLNFDIEAWLDAVDRRGIDAVMVWSFMAVRQKEDGSDVDPRWGYVVPAVGPWVRTGPGEATDGAPTWDLTRFDEERYWPRFRRLLRETEERGLLLWVTVFDGWAKERGSPSYHPFRVANGGPLERGRDFVVLDSYGRRVEGPYDADWPWQRRNQWIQERFAARIAEEVDPFDHVVLELFNEGAWYGRRRLLRHQRHFVDFLRARTDNRLAVNEDYLPAGKPGDPPRRDLGYDIASWHSHGYRVPGAHRRWLRGYRLEPALPLVDSETVPAFAGTADGPDRGEVRALVWSLLTAGGHVFVQDDAAFAFDPRAPRRLDEGLLDDLGHASRFFARPATAGVALSPCPARADPPYALCGDEGTVVAYVPNPEGAEPLRIRAPEGSRRVLRWFDPVTGTFTAPDTVVAGPDGLVVPVPGDGDRVAELSP